MRSRMYEMRRKEVINIRDGTRLGNVCDIEIDTVTASVLSLVIYGKLRFFGLFGREDDRVIPWSDIRIIGEDIVLVDTPVPIEGHHKKNKDGHNGQLPEQHGKKEDCPESSS
ncbi:MAG: YlmC/YmxH family sporulation protein [Oscillospiraceae bacterium]|nr:YlmC/YmxH family sporulation protein [Oscillospiraceae bacterium]